MMSPSMLIVPTLAALLMAATQARAGVNFVAPGVAGSVTNVTVGATVYDVTFVGTVTHAAWVSQLDFATEAEAQAAIVALAAELNAASAVSMRFSTPGGGTFDHTVGTLWYDADATSLYGETLIKVGSNWQLANPFPGGAVAPINNAFPLALDFTPVSVPVWTDLGGGTAGIQGVPQLDMTGPLTPVSSLGLDLSQAAPSALALVFISFSSTPTAFKGGTLHTVPVGALVVVTTDGSGSLTGSAPFPGAPSGTSLWFQVGVEDASVAGFGASLSNGVVGTVP